MDCLKVYESSSQYKKLLVSLISDGTTLDNIQEHLSSTSSDDNDQWIMSKWNVLWDSNICGAQNVILKNVSGICRFS